MYRPMTNIFCQELKGGLLPYRLCREVSID